MALEIINGQSYMNFKHISTEYISTLDTDICKLLTEDIKEYAKLIHAINKHIIDEDLEWLHFKAHIVSGSLRLFSAYKLSDEFMRISRLALEPVYDKLQLSEAWKMELFVASEKALAQLEEVLEELKTLVSNKAC